MLLDRSPAAYAREQGWSAGLLGQSSEATQDKKTKGDRTAFEVFAPQLADGNKQLDNLFSGEAV
jgi:ATP-dependent DNA helicase